MKFAKEISGFVEPTFCMEVCSYFNTSVDVVRVRLKPDGTR
jgi:hypothetical protein